MTYTFHQRQGGHVPRPIHFEMHATDPERVQTFYRTLFGWQFQSWGGPAEYWVITTGDAAQPGINGGLVRRRGPAPAEGQAVNAFVCTVDVPDVDATLGALPSAGGTVGLPDGNLCGVMRVDSAAP